MAPILLKIFIRFLNKPHKSTSTISMTEDQIKERIFFYFKIFIKLIFSSPCIKKIFHFLSIHRFYFIFHQNHLHSVIITIFLSLLFFLLLFYSLHTQKPLMLFFHAISFCFLKPQVNIQ